MTSDVTDTGQQTREALNAIFGDADPSTVFSEPIEVGEDVIITAAAWDRAGGFGFGSGGAGEEAAAGGGGGGGGGGSSEGRPVAIIHIGSGGVRVEPVVDLTKIAVTGLLAGLAVWRTLRGS